MLRSEGWNHTISRSTKEITYLLKNKKKTINTLNPKLQKNFTTHGFTDNTF